MNTTPLRHGVINRDAAKLPVTIENKTTPQQTERQVLKWLTGRLSNSGGWLHDARDRTRLGGACSARSANPEDILIPTPRDSGQSARHTALGLSALLDIPRNSLKIIKIDEAPGPKAREKIHLPKAGTPILPDSRLAERIVIGPRNSCHAGRQRRSSSIAARCAIR